MTRIFARKTSERKKLFYINNFIYVSFTPVYLVCGWYVNEIEDGPKKKGKKLRQYFNFHDNSK